MPLRYLKSVLQQIARDFRKLSVHVTDADMSRKANASPISELGSSISKLRRVQRLHVTSTDKSELRRVQSLALRFLSLALRFLRKLAPLRFFNWPLQFLSASSISEIPSSADFYRG
ncbi:hypothetical protein ACFX19_013334 [Malus domestica]